MDYEKNQYRVGLKPIPKRLFTLKEGDQYHAPIKKNEDKDLLLTGALGMHKGFSFEGFPSAVF